MAQKQIYRSALLLALAHAGLISAGFLLLADQFAFPEILRASSEERLALFKRNEWIVVPAYYAMGLTGLTQIGLAVLFHRAFRQPESATLLIALAAGVCGGAFQAMGFMRWPIAVPFLAEKMATASTADAQAAVALVEGTLNRYAGMVVGEHLGFLGQGFWTFLVGLAMLNSKLFSRVYGLAGSALGLLIVVSSLEQLGGPFKPLGMVSAQVSAAWLGWLLACGISLARAKDDGTGPKFGLISFVLLAGLMGAFVATSLPH